MNLVSSFIFWLFLIIWGALIPVIYFPIFIIKNRRLADHGAKVWAVTSLWMLKKLCKIDYEVIGAENLPSQGCIIACKHQSMWETIVMHLILNRPVYTFKKELLRIPFYGWYLQIMSGITIDRSGKASALKSLIKQSKKYLAENQTIVLFPQGTRVPIGGKTDKYPYQAGIAALYLSCGVKVVPVALNSGVFWGKNSLLKKPGKVTLEFLKPIEPGLKKREFLDKVEDVIEKRSDELCSNIKSF